MDEPDIVYCEVNDVETKVQPAPPPLPKRSENIPASFIKVNWPRRNYPPRSITTFTNSCKKCCQKSTSKTNVFLRAAVVSFFILSLVFMTLYFKSVFKRDQRDCLNVNSNISRDNTEKRRKPCILQNCSTVNNPKGGNNKEKLESDVKCSTHNYFTVKTVDDRFGYLRPIGDAQSKLLEFSTANPGRFRYLLNGVIQEISTSRCLNLVSPTEHQVILTPKCSGPNLLKWHYNESTQYLVHNEKKNCISPWDYSSRLPLHVKYVPGLSPCSEYNKVFIQYVK